MTDDYLLMKRGYYYQPAGKGYTGIKDCAARYSYAEACSHVGDGEGGVCMIRAVGAPVFSPAQSATFSVLFEREACARLAETRHKQWRMPHPDDAKPGEVCDDASACADIAGAIRARAG